MKRRKIAQMSVALGCCLWVAPFAVILGIVFPGFRRAAESPLWDNTLALLTFAFALGAPVLAIVGWVLSERGTRIRRLVLAQALVWFIVMLVALAAVS